MIFFKGCSKCRGDMHVNRDRYGAYVQCIQCGRITELLEESTSPAYATPALAAVVWPRGPLPVFSPRLSVGSDVSGR